MRKHIPHIISDCNACPYVQSIDTYNFTKYYCNYSKIDVTGFYKTTGIHPDCKLIDCMYVDFDRKSE
jgi:hypothetical protein